MPRTKHPRPTLTLKPPPEWRRGADCHWAINTTVRCQHRCVYCFEGDRHGLKDIPIAETKALLDQAAREVPAVIFMGAEPTLNPQLPELVRYAQSRGLGARISTNAVRLADWDYFLTLARAGLDGIELSFPYPDGTVYSRITRAAPAGFDRLLRALDNIARWKREFGRERSAMINANLVVSRFNVERLDEVLGHLARRLEPGSYVVTCKRLDMAPVLHEESFRRHMYVSLASLRRHLPALADRIKAGVRIGFRDFPLCAIPGLEMHDYDLGYWLNGVRVKQNFFRQDQMVDMYPEEAAQGSHPFDWLCEGCSLGPLCLRRVLFLQADSRPEHTPQPLRGSLPKTLSAWVRRQRRGPEVLAAPRRRTALGWALGELLADGASPSWTPLERGVIQVSDRGRRARLRLRRDGGRWLLESVGRPLPPWATPARDALAARLERLPPPPAGCLPEPPAASSSSTATWAAGQTDPSEEPSAGPRRPRRWDGFVSGLFLERWRAAAGREPGLARGRLEPAGGGVIRACGPAVGDEGEFAVLPRDGARSLGALCGPLRLQPTWLGSGAAGLLWLRAAYAACAALEAGRAWPAVVPRRAGTFLARVWGLFGNALMPRAGASGGLLGGWVCDEGLQLDLIRAAGRPYGILLVPADRAQKPYACGRGVGLQYTMPQGFRDEGRWLAIVDAYARVLGGPRR
ncbi:MAG: radical SAM protein [Elusimicrobia bacterium]|nr:radical SAM protein [Elusimicrobiota bacterium]